MSSTFVTTPPRALQAGGRGPHMLGWLEDAVLLLLVVLALPLAILVVGAPIAVVVQLVIEIGRHL